MEWGQLNHWEQGALDWRLYGGVSRAGAGTGLGLGIGRYTGRSFSLYRSR